MAELALAILPLCFSAVKGIIIAKKKLKILRHHQKEIKRLRKKFNSQTDIFLDECQLLFQEFLSPQEAEALIDDENNPEWTSPVLGGKVKIYLGRRYETFCEAVGEIKEAINSLSDALDTNTEVGDGREKPKLSKTVMKAVDVTVHQGKYDALIDGMKESNSEIKRIRKTASSLQRKQAKAPCTKRPRPLPAVYHQVMIHSRSFYNALRTFWSCFQAQHTSHDLRLLLDSKTDGNLRVILRYCTSSGFHVQDGLVDLMVRSQSLQLVRISVAGNQSTSNREAAEEERPAKKRVRFSEDSVTPDSKARPSEDLEQASSSSSTSSDLCLTGDVCSQLCCKAGTARGGYLDTPEDFRHHLSPVCNARCDHKDCLHTKALKEPTSLDRIFSLPVERTISVPEQVRLALKLVKGVLQFHSTPWLQPYWRLQDLSFFPTDDGLATSLSTLHISAELSKHHTAQPQLCCDDAVMLDDHRNPGDEDGIVDAQLACGIRNMTMHSLGVALLQIGQWNVLRPDDIVEVRKVADLAGRDSRLGPRYQKITQQCLDCDFGVGKKLDDPQLQAAIYRDVVCELESLVSTLEGTLPRI
ncbi:hypothetical protein BJ166DRAFT_526921 [Pestalotiopsis sp. NC0098]|nr:hypothetical protein BJ166DRAFT_526921 [Pestalotiopsis sp. NC0098]